MRNVFFLLFSFFKRNNSFILLLLLLCLSQFFSITYFYDLWSTEAKERTQANWKTKNYYYFSFRFFFYGNSLNCEKNHMYVYQFPSSFSSVYALFCCLNYFLLNFFFLLSSNMYKNENKNQKKNFLSWVCMLFLLMPFVEQLICLSIQYNKT